MSMELPLDQDYTVELGLDEPDDLVTLTGKLAELLSVRPSDLPPGRTGRVRVE